MRGDAPHRIEGAGPRASVIIPAHNEESVIAAGLEALLAEAAPGEFDVVVVCNGCDDRTAEVAAGFAERGVRVCTIDTPSKIAALNEGDRRARVGRRVYVDADVGISTASLRLLVEALDHGARAAAPHPRLDTSRCGPGVRAYAAVWRRLWHVSRGLGSGVYALSPEGRSAFGRFPAIIADDYFVFCVVPIEARACPDDAWSTVRPPHSLRELAHRRIRVERGNAEVRELGVRAPDADYGVGSILRRRPWLGPSFLVYGGVNLWARHRVQQHPRSEGGWNRDASSRATSSDPSPT